MSKPRKNPNPKNKSNQFNLIHHHTFQRKKSSTSDKPEEEEEEKETNKQKLSKSRASLA